MNQFIAKTIILLALAVFVLPCSSKNAEKQRGSNLWQMAWIHWLEEKAAGRLHAQPDRAAEGERPEQGRYFRQK